MPFEIRFRGPTLGVAASTRTLPTYGLHDFPDVREYGSPFCRSSQKDAVVALLKMSAADRLLKMNECLICRKSRSCSNETCRKCIYRPSKARFSTRLRQHLNQIDHCLSDSYSFDPYMIYDYRMFFNKFTLQFTILFFQKKLFNVSMGSQNIDAGGLSMLSQATTDGHGQECQ